ncbi:hypothetical protein BDN70DRAFT_820718, partial [Pholiota conissans]
MQIPADSFLGRTLGNINRLRTRRRHKGDSDPSSSSSDDGSGSDDPRRSNRNSEPAPNGQQSRSRHRGHGKTLIKPIAPKPYDGSPDARAFTRFVTEGTAYVLDGNVKKNRRVFVLSYYLTGRAYDFYTQKIAMSFDTVELQEFFDKLFDYCFPINYRTEVRKKLERTYQNNRPVMAYVHEIEELFNLLGTIDERQRVEKLWDGLKPSIQGRLYRDHLHPDRSSWDDI